MNGPSFNQAWLKLALSHPNRPLAGFLMPSHLEKMPSALGLVTISALYKRDAFTESRLPNQLKDGHAALLEP
jgi:hypothetical protein